MHRATYDTGNRWVHLKPIFVTGRDDGSVMDPCRCASSMWGFSQLQRQTPIALHSRAPVPEHGTAGIRSLSRSECEWPGRWRNQPVSSLPSLLALQPWKQTRFLDLQWCWKFIWQQQAFYTIKFEGNKYENCLPVIIWVSFLGNTFTKNIFWITSKPSSADLPAF